MIKAQAQIVTPEFTMVFPNLFEPKAFMKMGKPQGEPKYGLTMLFDPADVADLKAKAAEVAKQAWPGRAFGELKFPFRNGDAEAAKSEARKKDGSFFKGKVVIKSDSKFQPQLVGVDRKPIIDKNKVYSGAKGFAELNFVSYEGVNGGQDGVKAYVNFILVADSTGPRIAGKDAATVFAGIKGGFSDKNPLEDDISF